MDLAFTVTPTTLRGEPARPRRRPENETTATGGHRRAGSGWGMVHGMFAQTTQNWWWTAHPAAR
ncbi:trp operon leader peptide [Streptomyces sp. PKU-MA01144]|nr:trp operon leader peptide [Streptomyces sp. PKU-MA01144]